MLSACLPPGPFVLVRLFQRSEEDSSVVTRSTVGGGFVRRGELALSHWSSRAPARVARPLSSLVALPRQISCPADDHMLEVGGIEGSEGSECSAVGSRVQVESAGAGVGWSRKSSQKGLVGPHHFLRDDSEERDSSDEHRGG